MKRVAAWLRWLANWFDGYGAIQLVVPQDAVFLRAVILCAEQDQIWAGHVGRDEGKRHQVYATLLKEVQRKQLPSASKREIALAIEAVQHV